MNSYKINYHTLGEGKHNISFRIDSQVFTSVEDGEIRGGDCVADIVLVKGLSVLKLDVKINGTVLVDCDRCLEEVSVPIEFSGVLIVKVTNEVKDSEYLIDDKAEDTLLINPSIEELDLESYLYDSVLLSLPIQRIHPVDENGESGCNPDMLSRFTITEEAWDDDELDEEEDEEDDL